MILPRDKGSNQRKTLMQRHDDRPSQHIIAFFRCDDPFSHRTDDFTPCRPSNHHNVVKQEARMSELAKIVPHLWFADQAVEAANFYVSLFPDSHVDSITPIPAETPSGPAGSVSVVEFTLAGQQFQAISAGPLDPFNHAISFIVNCKDQAEIDRLWDALSAGGTIE